MSAHPPLARRLGLADAVAIGMGSMMGAGIFVAFAPAAAAAGSGVLAGLAVAALVAYCNATSTAQLAAQFPASGGAYLYGRRMWGSWPGFLAGWCFVVGKTASCAAMAMAFAAYAVPEPWRKPAAALAVVSLTLVNSFGVTRTAQLTRVLLFLVLAVLAVVAAAGWTAGSPGAAALADWPPAQGWPGILQAAGILFFAFAGYARIATLGEEVRDPARTIPRAVHIALGLTLVVYALVGSAVLMSVDPTRLAASGTPLVDVVAGRGWGWAVPLAQFGAGAAALGALLGLIAGIGRTALAMAREGDLPAVLGAVHPRHQVPHRAEWAVCAVVVLVVLVSDVRGAIGFSSFGVLLYYLVANVSAHRQQLPHRRYPRALQLLGAGGCVALVASLPPASILMGVAVLGLGILYRVARARWSPVE